MLFDDLLDSLKKRGLVVEWELYSQVLDWVARGKVKLAGRKVILTE